MKNFEGIGNAAAAIVILNVFLHAIPHLFIEDERPPTAFGPYGAGVIRLAMDRFCRLIREPSRGRVDVAASVWQRQVHVRFFDGHIRNNQPAVGFGDAGFDGVGDGRLHVGREPHRRMCHPLGGHSVSHGIADVQHVRLVVADFIVPCVGPRPAVFAGQPQAVRGFHQVIADRAGHIVGIIGLVFVSVKPRPVVAPDAQRPMTFWDSENRSNSHAGATKGRGFT